MEFEKRKAAALAAINSTLPDKSPKGNVDAPIVALLETINSHPSFFTTSSCSGRVSILSEPVSSGGVKKKARGGGWVYISHDPADPDEVLEVLFPESARGGLAESTRTAHPSEQAHLGETPTRQAAPTLTNAESTRPRSSTESTRDAQPICSLVFRFEPLIVAVECKDVNSAQSLVSLAISCGFRESGITSIGKRVIVAIRCSIRMEVPLGDTNMLMVSKEYVKYLVSVANEKMEANRQRTNNFHATLLKNGFSEVGNDVECGDCVSVNEEKDGRIGVMEVRGNGGVRTEDDTHSGSLGASQIDLPSNQITVIGEPIERINLWGHSVCTLDFSKLNKVIIFGGFGGMGRHARRNDSLLLDPLSGKLESIDFHSSPPPRLGHTASFVKEWMFVVGGRADPMNILNDVWVLKAEKNEWNLVQCAGCIFPPSHRHAAAVSGSKLYVFGGIQNGVISSSMYVLDTKSFLWEKICIKDEWPCARHSHCLVAYGSQLFMFGGYDGEKALGDLYIFDIQTCLWRKKNMGGRIPYARFSHMMFVYKDLIGILGGCPIRQHYQELSLLDLKSYSWMHVNLNSIGEPLFVRSAASIVGDDLVVIGGGASCYAFGTKFSEPVKINLLALRSLAVSSLVTDIKKKHVVDHSEENIESKEISNGGSKLNLEMEGSDIGTEHSMTPTHWVVRVDRKNAKLVKDILKKFNWLDMGRKVYSLENGVTVSFPVTEEFYAFFKNKQLHCADQFGKPGGQNLLEPINREGIALKDMSSSAASDLLVACGATTLADTVLKVKKHAHSPLKVMKDAVAVLLTQQNMPSEFIEQLPTRWERLGDVIVLPVTSFKDPAWESLGKQLWIAVADSLGTRRLARQGRVSATGTRDSTLEILVGDDGWIDHRENGILYSFDATKCMFSWGNLSEKLRMANQDCTDEIVVDLFAGIGYFVLPFLVRANAKFVYACEWNPHAIEALRRNLHANGVADRCTLLEGDNRVTAPKGIADRVCLGLLPTSEGSWPTAVRALRSKGGMLHIHSNVKDTDEGFWTEHVSKSIREFAESEGHCWDVSVEHVERVKWYAPHIRHLVADVRCSPREQGASSERE